MLHLVWFIVAIAAAFVAFQAREWIPYAVLGGALILWVLWILISVLSPAVPDRKCPNCGEEGLVKVRRGEPGVRCERCDFRDETMHVAYLDEW